MGKFYAHIAPKYLENIVVEIFYNTKYLEIFSEHL